MSAMMRSLKQFKPLAFALAGLLMALGFSAQVRAHSAICECFDNADGTLTCEAGFSDGSSSAGAGIKIVDQQGKLLLEGKMSAQGDFTFNKPAQDFRIIFDAGEGHHVEIDSRDIEQS